MSPTHDSMIENVITISPENTVTAALEIFKKANIRSLPVVDKSGNFLGVFGLRHLLLNLLPVSVRMEDGLQTLDFLSGAAPGIAKRYHKHMQTPVSELMEKDEKVVVDEETPTWEVLRVMALNGSPVSVVNPETSKFIGLVSRQSLLAGLEGLIEKMEAEGEIDAA